MNFWVSTVVPLMTTLYGALRLVLVVLAILALIKYLRHQGASGEAAFPASPEACLP